MKFFFTLLTIIVIGVALWFPVALWAGFYSVYTIPPSKEYPRGTTLVVHREGAEPMFNSPEATPNKNEQRSERTRSERGVQELPKQSMRKRTVLELPYSDWAYRKSLPPEPITK